MSGIGMMILGSKGRINPISSTMTVGSQSYTFIKTTYYADGWAGSGSQIGTLGGTTMGSMTAAGESISLYWQSTTNHTTAGQVSIEISGNCPTGYITSVLSNSVSLGAIGSPTYNSTYNTTVFTVGAASVTNPFGTSGTKTIAVT